MKRFLTIVCLLGALSGLALTGTACGPHAANVTPQAAVAHYATDLAQVLTTYQALIVKATEGTPPLLTVEQAKPRMDEIRKGLDAGQRLAELLKKYDALAPGSADRQAIVGQVQTALNAMSTLGLDAATLPAQLLAEGTRLVSNFTSIIANAKAAVAAGGL